jgi:hypothetical protein
MEYLNKQDRAKQFYASMPFIYMMIFPAVLFDFFLEIYHQVCFRLYGIELVQRDQYIKMDRHRLSKLKLMQKVNCSYCGYVNGLMAYGTKVAGETEKFWCAINHAETKAYVTPEHHEEFAEYDDYL